MNRTIVLLGAALALSGCGGGDDGRPEASRDAWMPDTAAPADSPLADSATAGSADRADERPLRRRVLWLVNPRREPVIVYASAGAGRVVLDSVPPRDSVRVAVESRAPKVGLQGMAAGRQAGADSLDLTGAGPGRWRIPAGSTAAPSGTGPDTAGG